MVSTAHMVVAPRSVLGKRPRHAENTRDDDQKTRPHKKGKAKIAANRVLVAVGAIYRASRKPPYHDPENTKSKAVGLGVGRHVATSTQGVHRQFSPGPNV